ncbi:L-histidine N(alpha)-methyltransferase [Yoonia sp. 2307UL14-13]|uniref:L-histidine N(alpha)-methyltransferase n=1 Tax=Yoonia sp. 2307UL14-13 TaxID=3126506 RepID=UPI0030B7DE8D
MDGSHDRHLDPATQAMLDDVLCGLWQAQKTLPPKWLYDHRGSELFEQITTLPEYHLTRTEAGILQAHATDLAGVVPDQGALIEFGSGASVKTRMLLDAGAHFGAYVPIDISADFLHLTADDLRGRYPGLNILPVVGDFTTAVPLPKSIADMPQVGFFPGSTIGNLEPEMACDLLANARDWPKAHGFILGADMVNDIPAMIAAYDDAQGITAAFISNILVRINTELSADFDLDQFGYRVTWNAERARIDMWVYAKTPQIVTIHDQRITFDKDEHIHISAARKYTPESLAKQVHQAGWIMDEMLTDQDDKFAVAVLRATEVKD